jgi:hypothetical protein
VSKTGWKKRNHPRRTGVQQNANSVSKEGKPDNQQDGAQGNRSGTSSEIPHPKSHPPDQRSDDQTSKTQQPTSDAVIAKWTKILGRSTIALFLATFGTGVVLFLTELTLRDTLMETRKAANAAEDAAGIAKQALTQGSRAFVFVKGGGDGIILKTVKEDGRRHPSLQINPIWENTGNTRTVDLEIKIFCHMDGTSGLTPFDYSNEGEAAKIVLGPKQTEPVGRCLARFPDNTDDFVKVAHYFYVGGQARYRDVFDSKYTHVTQYCRQFLLNKIDSDPVTGIVTYSVGSESHLCPTHNCADEECAAENRK